MTFQICLQAPFYVSQKCSEMVMFLKLLVKQCVVKPIVSIKRQEKA